MNDYSTETTERLKELITVLYEDIADFGAVNDDIIRMDMLQEELQKRIGKEDRESFLIKVRDHIFTD